MAGFVYKKSLVGGQRDLAFANMQLAASLDVTKGDALKVSAGELAMAGATDVANFIAQETVSSGAADIVKPDVIAAGAGQSIFECSITPFIDGTVISGSTTTVVVDDPGSNSNDFMNGGEVCIKELNEQRVILDSAVSGGNVTITVGEAFSRAPAAGETVRATVVGLATIAGRMNSTSDGLDTELASGGKVTYHKIDLKRKMAEVSFNPS